MKLKFGIATAASAILAVTLVPAHATIPEPISQSADAAAMATSDVLRISWNSKRAGDAPLHGHVFNAIDKIYVFAQDDGNVKSVTFYHNDKEQRTENATPFDYVGGDKRNNAKELAVSELTHGQHKFSAVITRHNGETERHDATFTVNNPDKPKPGDGTQPIPGVVDREGLQYGWNHERRDQVNLNGNTFNQHDEIFIVAKDKGNIRKVEFFLDGATQRVDSEAPFDFAGANEYNHATPLKIADLSAGGHEITAKVTFNDDRTETYAANIVVNAPHKPVEPQPTDPAIDYTGLRTSWNNKRTDHMALHQQTFNQHDKLHIFAEDRGNVKRVEFFLDGQSKRVEKSAPFDFAGGDNRNDANPFSLKNLSAGGHEFKAEVTYHDGRKEVFIAQVTVNESSHTEPEPVKPDPEPVKPNPGNGDHQPAPGQKPLAHNTGVRPGAKLKSRGSLTVTQNGAVIENLDIKGTLTIRANNVTVRNVRVKSKGSFAISVASGFGGTLIENCEVSAGKSTLDANSVIQVLGDMAGKHGKGHGDNAIIRSCNISGFGDGIKMTRYMLVEKNYIHVSRAQASYHLDGIQNMAYSHFTIRGNNIDNVVSRAKYPGNAAIQFETDHKDNKHRDVRDAKIINNWMNGGTYILSLENGPKGAKRSYFHDLHINDNIFGDSFQFGYVKKAPYHKTSITGNYGVKAKDGSQVPLGQVRK